MDDEEMALLVDRLAADPGSWRKLKIRVEARRHELFPPTPPYHGIRDEEGPGSMAVDESGRWNEL